MPMEGQPPSPALSGAEGAVRSSESSTVLSRWLRIERPIRCISPPSLLQYSSSSHALQVDDCKGGASLFSTNAANTDFNLLRFPASRCCQLHRWLSSLNIAARLSISFSARSPPLSDSHASPLHLGTVIAFRKV